MSAPSDLSGMVAGLKLEKLDVTAARLDQPVQVSGQGSFNNSPATLAGSLGAPAALLAGAKAAAPIPLDLSMQALGSSLTVKGTAARGQDGRPSVQAVVTSDKIDLDALLAALAKPTGRPVAAAPAAPPAPTAKPAASGRLIPDTPIPFDLLRLADADVKLSVAQLVVGGAHLPRHRDAHRSAWRQTAARPAHGRSAGRSSQCRAQRGCDAGPSGGGGAAAASPRWRCSPCSPPWASPATSPAICRCRPTCTAAAPRRTRSRPASMVRWGSRMANGTVDNRLLGSTLGSILREVNLLDLVGRGGTSQVQCFAARLDASHGIATVRSLVLASSLLTMDGGGSLNLGAETLDLRVRPQARLPAPASSCRCGSAGRSGRRPPRPTRRGGHRECGNRGGSRAGQHDAARADRRRAGREASCSAARRRDCGAASRRPRQPAGRRGTPGRARRAPAAGTAAEAARRGQRAEAAVPLRGRA